MKRFIYIEKESSVYQHQPIEMPAWLQGLGLALLFGVVLFGDAIVVWLS